MATESACKLRIGREQYQGTARLDAEHIDFAGGMKFRFRFSEMRNPARAEGALTFDFHGHSVRLDVGPRTEKWLDSILHPKSLSDKLGVRAGHIVRLVNFDDPILSEQIAQKKAKRVGADHSKPCDVIVLGIERPAELRQLESLADELQPDGAIWVMLPRVSKALTPANVPAAARQIGLIESKATSYSDAYSAFKLMLPPSRRTAVVRSATIAARRPVAITARRTPARK